MNVIAHAQAMPKLTLQTIVRAAPKSRTIH